MVKSQTNKNQGSKDRGPKGSSAGKIQKRKEVRKKKSIHANTFEERQENRRRKEEIAQKKQQAKDRRIASRARTFNLISEVSTWVTDNPLHPSVVPQPTQEGIRPVNPVSREHKTYKLFLKNLPPDVTPQEIDEHFYNRKGVQIHTIRLLCHRKTSRCLGWGFLEFNKKLEFEKSLAFNFSLFKERRIIVQQSLRTFVPSKKTPQKLISYRTPKKTGPPKSVENDIQENKDNDVQVLESEGMDVQ